MPLPRTLLALFCSVLATMSSAHELWIEPESWAVAPGEEIRVNIRNGEIFDGSKLSWFDRGVARADMILGDIQVEISGRMGDRPALVSQAQAEGLCVVLYETTPSFITYKTWEKFQKFVDHKDLGITQDTHIGEGHPAEGFKESYTRHAKTLVQVGTGGGEDQTFGLETELVALENPYATDFANEMGVVLYYQGAPRKDAQIEQTV